MIVECACGNVDIVSPCTECAVELAKYQQRVDAGRRELAHAS